MVAAHKPKNPNKLDDSGVFLSKGSINNFPKDVSKTLFFTATSFDLGDREPAPEEGKRENFLKLHEIGGRDCKVVKYPEIPNLTRKSQTYSISFRPKQSTDWEVNQFVVQTKRAGTGAGVPAPSYALSSTYQDLSKLRSAAELEHAKPAWTRPKDVAKAHQPSMISRSLSQDTFAGEHSGFKAIGDRFLPIHELSVDLGSRDFWSAQVPVPVTVHMEGPGPYFTTCGEAKVAAKAAPGWINWNQLEIVFRTTLKVFFSTSRGVIEMENELRDLAVFETGPGCKEEPVAGALNAPICFSVLQQTWSLP
eukprot:s2482_g7.t1